MTTPLDNLKIEIEPNWKINLADWVQLCFQR